MVPAAASAQAVPAAVIAVVDLDKVTSRLQRLQDRAGGASREGHALQSQAKGLSTPLQTEQKSIQAAIDALKGTGARRGAPGPHQGVRDQAAQAGASELPEAARSSSSATSAISQKQISDKLGPIYQQVMQKRGANVMLEVGSTLATRTSVDVTADVTDRAQRRASDDRHDGAGSTAAAAAAGPLSADERPAGRAPPSARLISSG